MDVFLTYFVITGFLAVLADAVCPPSVPKQPYLMFFMGWIAVPVAILTVIGHKIRENNEP